MAQSFTKEQVTAYKKAYNDELYRLVYEKTQDAEYAKQYVKDNALSKDDKSVMWDMERYSAERLASVTFEFN